ncbi:MAG: HAD family phosphatase [Deltaproteobacteria bacterium]|nr:HAD family phosphatase [Deltaproteobacteria bacterium]
MIRAVVFDLDGVLVDSEALSCGATADLLTARGVPMTEPDVRRLFLGKPIAAVYDHVRALGCGPLPASFAEEKERLYFERARGRLRAFAGAEDVIATVGARLPIAIASSGSPRKVAFSLGETGLSRLFSVVCTTAEVARGKPAPDLFLLAAERLHVSPQDCAIVEDARPGIEAARAAGAFAVGVTWPPARRR